VNLSWCSAATKKLRTQEITLLYPRRRPKPHDVILADIRRQRKGRASLVPGTNGYRWTHRGHHRWCSIDIDHGMRRMRDHSRCAFEAQLIRARRPMSLNSDNRRRLFAEVVSVEAWHDPFSPKVPKVNLCADVVFGEARVGGDIESPVRFSFSRCLRR